MGVCEANCSLDISKMFRQGAPAGFPAFVNRKCAHNEDPLWRLPAAQSRATEREQLRFADCGPGDHAGHDLLVPQRRIPPKNHRLPNVGVTQQLSFHFCRVHFFACDIDDIGDPAHEAQTARAKCHEIVWKEESVA